MTNPFRSVDACDILDDNRYRLTKQRLDELGLRTTIWKCMAVLVLIPVLVFGPSSWLTGWMPPLVGGGIFLLFVPAAIWMAWSFEKDIRGEVVGLHAALYPRMVALVFPWFFMMMALTLPGGRYTGAALLGLGLLGALWTPAERPQSATASKLGRVARKCARVLMDIPGSIWFQIVLFWLTVKSLLIVLAYLLEFTAVWLTLSRKPQEDDHRQAEGAPAAVPAAEPRHFRVAQLSDLHFMGPQAPIGLEGRTRNQRTLAFLCRHGTQIANADLIAVTGDITDTGFRDEWMEADKAFDALSTYRTRPGALPCAIVPGNHDLNIFASFDPSVDDLPKYQQKLALLGVSNYANRGVRFVRYLAFWDKWSGAHTTVHPGSALAQSGRAYLANHAERLNKFAMEAAGRRAEESTVTRVFDHTYPAVTDIKGMARVYTLDSNARTWHVAANSLGMFGLRQLWRLWRLLGTHPDGQGAVFLLHHHVRPGIKKHVPPGTPWYQRFDEYSMATVDSFLFCWILERRLKQTAFVLHGHTHYERDYGFGIHRVICAPSTGYGEASKGGKSNRSYVYEFKVDGLGALSLTSKHQLDKRAKQMA